jgi:hypothetical protein
MENWRTGETLPRKNWLLVRGPTSAEFIQELEIPKPLFAAGCGHHKSVREAIM